FGVLLLILLITAVVYQIRHTNRIFTGVSVWGVDLSGMTREEAAAALAETVPDAREGAIELVDQATGRSWQRSPASLGISYDLEQTVEAAYAIGRKGGPLNILRDQFIGWYYGRPLAPGIIFDEGALYAELQEIAA